MAFNKFTQFDMGFDELFPFRWATAPPFDSHTATKHKSLEAIIFTISPKFIGSMSQRYMQACYLL